MQLTLTKPTADLVNRVRALRAAFREIDDNLDRFALRSGEVNATGRGYLELRAKKGEVWAALVSAETSLRDALVAEVGL